MTSRAVVRRVMACIGQVGLGKVWHGKAGSESMDSYLEKVNRAEASESAFASGIDSVISAAMDCHRNTARAFTALSADVLRAERLATFRRAYRDEDADADRLAFDERVQPYDV